MLQNKETTEKNKVLPQVAFWIPTQKTTQGSVKVAKIDWKLP